MPNSLFAWSNYAKQAIITATSQATSLPAGNVANDSGSAALAWQTVAGVVTSGAGALIQIQPLVASQSWDVIGCFRTNLTNAASVTFSLWTNLGALVWSQTYVGPVPGYGQVVALPPAGTTADYCQIGFNDPTNPDGFINIPMIFAGAAWRPLGSVSYSSAMGRDTTTSEATSRGGQEFPTLYYQRKRWVVTLDAVRSAEQWSSADIMNIYSSAGSNVLFIPDVNDAYVPQECIFGRLKPTSDLTYPYQVADRRRITYTITERL